VQGCSCRVPDFSGVIGYHKRKSPLAGANSLLLFNLLDDLLVHLGIVFLRLRLTMLFVSLMKSCLLLRGHTLSIFGVLFLVGLLSVLRHYIPFFRTALVFLALPFESDFLSYFLLAAFRVFMPCLSFGLPQPQVAHIIFCLSCEGSFYANPWLPSRLL